MREKFVEVDASVFAAKTKNVRALYPAYGIEKVVIILGLELVGWRRGAKLEAGGTKQAEFVNGGSDVVGGAIDAHIRDGNRRIVDQTVLDAHVAEAEVVDEGGRKQMGFRDAEETAGNGRSYGKFKSVALMLLAKVPPREACNPPAPKGRSDSALEKKKRAETLSVPLRNSRSQLVVNWSSVYLPGRLMIKGAELRLTEQSVGFTVTPASAGLPTEGNKKPPASPN